MSKKTWDVIMPLAYVAALGIAVAIHRDSIVGGVAIIGAVILAVYYVTLRK